MCDVVVKKTEQVQMKECDILNVDFGFEEKMVVAAEVATSLKKVLTQQNLTIKIKKNEYVLAEGWNTLGTMLGTSPETIEVKPFKGLSGDMGYKAVVCIKKGDSVLARAEAIDLLKYDKYKRPIRDEEGVYSMAQTRAMGKAYRSCFSWIVKMAGFEPTPAEEMVDVAKKNDVRKPTVQRKTKPAKSTKSEQKPKTKSADEAIEARVVGEGVDVKNEDVENLVVKDVENLVVNNIGDPKFESMIESVCSDIFRKVHLPPSKTKVVRYVELSKDFEDDVKKELIAYIKKNWYE